MFLLVIFIILPCALTLPNPDSPNVESNTIWKDCDQGIFSPRCVKISAKKLLDRLNKNEEIQLLPGVSLVKELISNESSEVLNREGKLDQSILYQLSGYLDSHSLKFKLMDKDTVREARSMLGEARKKDPLSLGGKKGGMGTIMAMAMMMKGTLMSVGLGGLALLAGKALMTAMMSLLLSAIIGIKSLTSGGKSTTYEIVAKPVYSHSHSHSTGHEEAAAYGHSGYGRSLRRRR